MFYELSVLAGKNDVFVESVEGAEPFAAYSRGEPIQAPPLPPRLIYQGKKRRTTDLVAGIHVFPVVSSRLRAVAASVEPEFVQFLPVELVCGDTGKVHSSYFFMNVLHNLDAFDWERSVYTPMAGTRAVLEAEKICLRGASVGRREMFRVHGLLTHLFIGSNMQKALNAAGLRGLLITPVECS